MAYQVALNSQVGDEQYLRLDVPFDLFTTPTYYLEIDIQVFENGVHILTDGLNINVLEIGVDSLDRTTRLKRGSTNMFWYRTGLPDTNDFYKFGFEKVDAQTYELFINDVSLGQRVNAELDDASILFDTIAKSYRNYFKINLRSIKYYDQKGGALLRHYDPSVSVGAGYLVEKISGAHAYPEGITNFDDVLEYYDDGSSASVAQPITTITAESNHEASIVPLVQSLALNVGICEHRTDAEILNTFVSQLTITALAQARHEASLLSIEQTAAQSIGLISSEQITHAQNLTATQRSILSSIIAEQLNEALTSTLTNVQAITYALVEQVHEAAPLSLNQFTGQLVTLLVAEQSNDAQTLLISNVNALDVIFTEQISQASLQSINQHHQIEIITAEQLAEAQIINLLANGDNTDLSGLSLQPITSIYSITPITKRYSFNKV